MQLLPDAPLYLVPVIEANCSASAQFHSLGDGALGPASLAQALEATADLCRRLVAVLDGHFVLSPYSGPLSRTGFYEGEFLELYRRAHQDGVDLAVHLHEESADSAPRYGDADHMRLAFEACERRLGEAGIPVAAYRGGCHAYAPFMNRILEDNGIFVDMSCRPGLAQPAREAVWGQAELNGAYLFENPRGRRVGASLSQVFEIPVGSDGLGAAPGNILHINESDAENLSRILSAIFARARSAGRPQFVHCLFHTGGMAVSGSFDRLSRFLDNAREAGAVMVTATEAHRQFDAVAEAAGTQGAAARIGRWAASAGVGMPVGK